MSSDSLIDSNESVDEDAEAASAPALTADEAQYDRDEDGNLKPVKEVIDTEHGPRTVKLKPLVPTELMDLEDEFGDRDDLPADAIFDLLNDYVLEPEGVDWGRTSKLQATMSLIEVVFGQFSDDTDELKQQVGDELAKRDDGAQGN